MNKIIALSILGICLFGCDKKVEDKISELKEKFQVTYQKLDNLTDPELWKEYKDLKETVTMAKQNDEFELLIKTYEKTASIMKKLGEEDILAWQLNNVGYYIIEQFKKETGYPEKITKITDDAKRKIYWEDLKKKEKHLKKAKAFLKEAKKIDANLNNAKRSEIIKRNINFIDTVLKDIQSKI